MGVAAIKLNDPLQFYPPGTLYFRMDDVDPGTIFGGTWQRISGRFILASGTGTDINGTSNTFGVNTTGGEYTHTLSAAESGVPAHHHSYSHTHTMKVAKSSAEASGYGLTKTDGFKNRVMIERDASGKFSTDSQSSTQTGDNGAAAASSAHNNIPPYIAVAVWVRIS